MRWLAVLLLCGGCMCGPGADIGGASGDPPGGGGAGSGSGSAGGAWGGGGQGGSGAGASSGCRKLDIVISVDNSSSMSEEKSAMRDVVFPGFASALKRRIATLEDFRVGVLDACPFPANFHTRGASGACGYQSGKVWMDSRSSRLTEEFSCVGDIWSADMQCSGKNDDEQPASSVAASLEPPNLTGPNSGFLRDDAVLVAVAITDEDEQPTPDKTALAVYQRLVATKGGEPKRLVFLGIGGRSDCSGVYGGAKEAVKLKAITAHFEAAGRGIFWDLCAGNLEAGLDRAVDLVAQACKDFPAEGGAGKSCSSDGQCGSGKCVNGVCEGGPGGKPNGSSCSSAGECASAVCVEGICVGIS